MAAASTTTRRDPPPSSAGDVPRLESGDHLSRAEFERRYEAMPDLKKAELIEGVVYVGSPVRIDQHGRQHALAIAWLGVYCAGTPGLDFADNTTVRLDEENEPQPDILLRIDRAAGGRSTIEEGYVDGPPELVVEVAASSASMDRNTKLRVYRRNGVREYVIWRVLDKAVDWFALEGGEYVALQPDEQGIIRSRVFPGLVLNVPALLSGDLAAVVASQQTTLGSDAHRRFVEYLASARAT
jgi:Uma2 family endonuclease